MARKKTPKVDDLLLKALVCGATVENAARKAGVTERTVYRRLEDPAFQAALKQASQQMLQRTAAMLSGASIGCVKTLVDLQQDAAVEPTVRRRAARDVLELNLRFRDRADLEPRLTAAEERLAAIAIGQGPANDTPDPTNNLENRSQA
jgi:AcrR family transcriptional regulator